MKIISLFVLFLLLVVSCLEEPGDPWMHDITVESSVYGSPDVYLAFIYKGLYSDPKIADVNSRMLISFGPDVLEYSQKLSFFDDFTIKLYSSEVTNTTNWDRWNQHDLNMEGLEGLVYYATNISNGLSRPELFNSGNDLPFYLSTNAGLQITVKELQTNR